ncbi:MAG: glutaredoxin [Vampirovibrionales bacterium]|jgi:monothiol glutaredoxin|nr:glutaredoxin [Vampirovibrionales bacterium]
MNAIETSPFYNEVEREIAENPIMIYSKGTKDFPRCGFTMRLKDTFEQLGVDFVMQDVLDNPDKRLFLNEYCEWPTLPKVFVQGEFCGGTDIVLEMLQKGELQPILEKIKATSI